MRQQLKYHIPVVVFLMVSLSARGQFFHKLFSTETDTNYVINYSSELTTRLYGSVKSASFRLADREIRKSLDYLPNDKLLLGVGVNHGFLGINVGINFPFVNKDDDRYGTTDYLNLTTRIFARKLYIELLLQYYHGYYNSNSYDMISSWPKDTYMIRGDLRTFSIGLSMDYIFNNKKFSLRAGFLQNEWQKKSAGSLLAGAEIYYHVMAGDSSLIPQNLKDPSFFKGQHFKRVNIFSAGPLIGYTHTFVVKKHWFLSLYVTVNLALGYSRSFPNAHNTEKSRSGLTVNFNTGPMIAFGYNSAKWCFDISYNNLSQRNQSPFDQAWIQFDTGNFRFNIVRRFHIKKPLRILNPEY